MSQKRALYISEKNFFPTDTTKNLTSCVLSTAPIHIIALLWLHLTWHASSTSRKIACTTTNPNWSNKRPRYFSSKQFGWCRNVDDCWSSDWSCTACGHITLFVPVCMEVSFYYFMARHFVFDKIVVICISYAYKDVAVRVNFRKFHVLLIVALFSNHSIICILIPF